MKSPHWSGKQIEAFNKVAAKWFPARCLWISHLDPIRWWIEYPSGARANVDEALLKEPQKVNKRSQAS